MLNLMVLRDLSIIVLAIESIVVGIFLIVLTIELRRLAMMLDTEIKPLLISLNDTAATVKGTTDLLSDTVAQPIIRASSFVTGVRALGRSLRRPPGKRAQGQPSSRAPVPPPGSPM
jgi:hypothetical protein